MVVGLCCFRLRNYLCLSYYAVSNFRELMALYDNAHLAFNLGQDVTRRLWQSLQMLSLLPGSKLTGSC
jgi:hypothetical protein